MRAHEYLPLKPDVFVILAVLRRGPAHGYALMQQVQERTRGRMRLQAGPLYRRLRWMLDEGLIEEIPGEDARRRTYRVTRLGERIARADAERMADLMAVAGLDDLPQESR